MNKSKCDNCGKEMGVLIRPVICVKCGYRVCEVCGMGRSICNKCGGKMVKGK